MPSTDDENDTMQEEILNMFQSDVEISHKHASESVAQLNDVPVLSNNDSVHM